MQENSSSEPQICLYIQVVYVFNFLLTSHLFEVVDRGSNPANTKHLYNIYTTSAQRL